MSKTSPSKARSVFLDAVENVPSSEWDAYLDRVCQGDQELLCRVRLLLDAHARSDDLIDHADGYARQARGLPLALGQGSQIGHYTLVEQIGEGGMGVVYVAEQTLPIRRRVALKLIKPGMDSRLVIARFEAERQALALMDHPNIARVFDAGTTGDGRPYFVMEFVNGVPITEFCDKKRLSIHDRLELLLLVCRAVQHAHQKGIIHRDLKPSNILVAVHDAAAVVKVIDFGVAKALGQELTDKTLFTTFAQMIGTPQYMSPEQAGQSGLDIDTRSDIYSLGVLLYELLTGMTPFTKEHFERAGYEEIRHIIREVEPPKPSTRLSESIADLPSISAARQAEPAKLTKLLRGELDWIVLKCLEKDRSRRYETANGLGMDLQRFLATEPVLACPPSRWYRIRKYASRNGVGLTITGLVLFFLTLLGGLVGRVMFDRAARQAALEQEVTVALREAEQLRLQGEWTEALSVARRAEGLLAGTGSEAIYRRVGAVRSDLEMVLRLDEIRFPPPMQNPLSSESAAAGRYEKAFQDYGIDVTALAIEEAAKRIREQSIRFELVAALDDWARVRKLAAQPGDSSWKRIVAVARFADPDEWRNHLRDALIKNDLATLRELVASPRISTLPVQTLSLLGSIVEQMGDDGGPDPAQRIFRLAQSKYPGDFQINLQLAWSLEHRPHPQWDEALRFYTAALAVRPHHAGVMERLKSIASTYYMNGIELHRQKKFGEAVVSFRKAIQIDPQDAELHYHLGNSLNDQSKFDEAIASYREAIGLDPNSWASNPLGTILLQRGELDEAIACFETFTEVAPMNGAGHANLGYALGKKVRWKEAIDCFKKALELDPSIPNIHNHLAWLLATSSDTVLRDPHRAVQLAKKAIELAPHEGTYWNTLGVAHYRAGSWQLSIDAMQKSVELQNGSDAFDWFFLAMAHWRLGHEDEARKYYDRAAQLAENHAQNKEELNRFWAEAAQLFGVERKENE